MRGTRVANLYASLGKRLNGNGRPKIYLAEEIKDQNPTQLANIKQALPNVEIEFMPHSDLKKSLAKTHAFIRTGEATPYSNIILESGVTF